MTLNLKTKVNYYSFIIAPLLVSSHAVASHEVDWTVCI